MAAATAPKTETVSKVVEVPTDGTIVTVFDKDRKASLSAALKADHAGADLSDYTHEIVVEDYSAGVAHVKVSATATAKK